MHKRRPAYGPAFENEIETLELLTPLHWQRRSPARHVRAVEDRVGPHVRWRGRQHLLLAINQVGRIERRQFKSVPVRNRIGRASFHAISAEDAPVVVDVVDLRISFGAAYPVGLGVLRRLDIDAVRRAGGGAQETCHALLQPVLVALQHVHPTKTFLEARAFQRPGTVRVVLDLGRLKHLHEGDAHTFGNRRDIFQPRHRTSVYRKPPIPAEPSSARLLLPLTWKARLPREPTASFPVRVSSKRTSQNHSTLCPNYSTLSTPHSM